MTLGPNCEKSWKLIGHLKSKHRLQVHYKQLLLITKLPVIYVIEINRGTKDTTIKSKTDKPEILSHYKYIPSIQVCIFMLYIYIVPQV